MRVRGARGRVALVGALAMLLAFGGSLPAWSDPGHDTKKEAKDEKAPKVKKEKEQKSKKPKLDQKSKKPKLDQKSKKPKLEKEPKKDQCVTDADCADGEICRENGKCHKAKPCKKHDCEPEPQEFCGDCVDNDGNGLVDFEDPACCSAGRSFVMALRTGRMIPRGDACKVKLSGALAGTASVNPQMQDVQVQIRPQGGDDVFCASIPAGHFARRGRTFGYRAGRYPLSSAKGIDKLVIKRLRKGGLRFRLKGRQVQMRELLTGPINLTLGFVSTDGANSCSTLTNSFRRAARGAVAVR
jgi:hypothetical protein